MPFGFSLCTLLFSCALSLWCCLSSCVGSPHSGWRCFGRASSNACSHLYSTGRDRSILSWCELDFPILCLSHPNCTASLLSAASPRLQATDLRMQDVFVTVFLMLATIPGLHAKDFDNSQFEYDYESLKVAGLIVAGILCAMGIIILLSGKCRCKFNKKSEQRHRAQEQQLIAPGSASHC
ncbi:uncharacterized protein [Pyxicephalus adspersus]|uniref:uncharacterized protein isoform X2 n=1 Tax=Pyxicephalus adspersus TaxID=30357 RepID=UPI003B599355